MRQNLRQDHRVNSDENPTGGYTLGAGIDIKWQDGPLGRGIQRTMPNGAFVEGVIEAAIGRLEFFQRAADGRFACQENADAIGCLREALAHLDIRTRDREERGVEGTHVP